MRETNEEKKPKEVNIKFIAFNIALGMILIISVILGVVDKLKWNICGENAKVICAICQGITTAGIFVGSVIGMTISLQKEEVMGVAFAEFNKLRGPYHYTVGAIIVGIFLFSVLNAVFYLCELVIACLGISAIAIIFCIYVASQEIPLMMRNEKKLLRVVKERMRIQWETSKTSVLSGEIYKVVQYLICNKTTLKHTYGLLKGKDLQYNKQLLATLLDVQLKRVKDIILSEDKILRYQIAGAIQKNISDILYSKFDLTEELKEPAPDYINKIRLTLLYLSKMPEFTQSTADLVAEVASLMDCREESEQKIFILIIILRVISNSVTTKYFSFAKAMRKVFSQHKYSLGRKKTLSALFSMMSVHFYYLCNDARNVDEDFKKQIKEFINFEGIEGNTVIHSWKKLLYRNVDNTAFGVQDLIDLFNLIDGEWDVPVYSSEAYFIVFTNNYILQWYLMCLFKSTSVWEYDFGNLLAGSQETKIELLEIGDQLLNDNTEEIFTPQMLKMAEFYNLRPEFKSKYISKVISTCGFSDFIKGLRREKFNAMQAQAEAINIAEIIKAFSTKIEANIVSEWGYSEKIGLDNESKYIQLVLEKLPDVGSYEIIIEDLASLIIEYIQNNISPVIIKRDKNYDETVAKTLKLYEDWNFTKRVYSYEHTVSKKEIKELVKAKLKSENAIKSRILTGYYIVKRGGFSFNCKIEEITTKQLNPEQISQIAEAQKRTDGQYVYNGELISREEIENIIGKRWFILTIEFRCKVVTEGNAIFKIENKEII